ncbi:MAG: PAS domain S-box protein [Phenylobacterium sp.]|uniref:PAS domain-containing hybrid sensor histidine kinase/response regulator n=1 Tax=Phenylobacterium sp. TaxID=1871053 RepID=UPI001B42756E|nr:PAS domain S-box protein [Phenylobacterium sp.]MBP7817483.1 PAS domain S-box protein [Phenylobacterium sp.]
MATTEDVLAFSEARYRLITEQITDVVSCCDAQGILTFVSPSSEALLGYLPEELLGKESVVIVHPDDQRAVRKSIIAYLAAGPGANPPRIEYRAIRKDGRQIWIESRPIAIRDSQTGEMIELQDCIRDVTARREAEAALVRSEERYRLIVEQVTDVVACCDPKGFLTYVSPSSEALFGYRPEELVGGDAGVLIHPDDQKTVRRAVVAFVAQGPGAPPPSIEYRALRKDGRIIWVEARPVAVFDPKTGELIELQDSTRDVTARREAEAALANSEARYRLLAENAADMIICYDWRGVLSYLSPSVRRMGYEPEELVGKRGFSSLHPEDRDRVVAAVMAYAQAPPGSEPIRYQHRGYRKDGTLVWLESISQAIHDPETGVLLGFQDVVRDVSDRKALEDELGAARDAAEAATAVKSAFLANMSHEIRTPLTAILGFSSLLAQRLGLDALGRQHLERIQAGSQALLSIVNDVLDFSKLEAGQTEITPAPVAIAKTTEEVLALFQPQAEAKGLALVFETDGTLPDHLMVDPDRLRQILFNLIGNAVKFTEAGSVRLKVAYARDLERLHLFVADTGVGMDASQTARLFQRFSQVDAASTRKHGGTGLGLAICKGLVEAMGGGVSVESTPGQGSVFHVHLWAPPTDLAGPAEPASEAAPAEDLRVLVVDDNDVNRELARLLLESFGVRVSEAQDGEAALTLAQIDSVDLILMDIRMPRLDGPSTLRRLRAQPGPNQGVPVLAFSADADLEGAPWAREFDGLVRKPIVAAELLAEMDRCLQAAG